MLFRARLSVKDFPYRPSATSINWELSCASLNNFSYSRSFKYSSIKLCFTIYEVYYAIVIN